jgi:predicted dehydrogenase
MGWANLTDFLLHKEVRCLALADIDKNVLSSRAEELTKIQGKKPDIYSDYRKILDRKDIDIVIIGTPDHWHCLQFVDSCKAGKDIYVEKPLSNSIAECEVMVEAAKKYGRIVQVGQQQRSGNHWHKMVEYLQSGQLGTVGRVHVWANFDYAAIPTPVSDSDVPEGVDFDTWLGHTPKVSFNTQRFHGSWRMFWNYGGGLITDWGVHLLDMALWGMNVKTTPLNVLSNGGNYFYPNGVHETFDTMSVVYQFKDFIIEWENNTLHNGLYGKNYGVLFRGTNGTLVADRADWQIYPEGEKISAMTVKSDEQEHKRHVTNFLECVKNRNVQTACPVENGSLCAKYSHIGNISARLGGVPLHYDEVNKQFTGNPEADKYLKPNYGNSWIFPSV